MEQNKHKVSIPDNAYRELKAGEEYEPIMSADSSPKEVTPYSVTMGIVMAVVFSAAAAFLGLKVGQVFEAAIPIAIIAVGMGSALGKSNMLGQNVIIQSIGACSGVVVAGAIFTLPALYILGLDAQFYQIFLSSLLGGILGIVLLIPFRKYFVKDMHGKYPFPEATATTEVLVSGEKGGNQAKLLVLSEDFTTSPWPRSARGPRWYRPASARSEPCAPTSSRWSSRSIRALPCWAWATS